MFWEMFIKGIRNCYMDDIYILMMFVAIVAMMDYTFVKKWNPGKTILAWGCICAVLVFVFRLLYAIQYTIFYCNESFFGKHKLAYDIFYNFGVWMYFIQILLLIAGAKIIYQKALKVKIFAILLLYMFVSLIADYFMPLLLVIFNPKVTENGYYIEFEKGGGILYLCIGAGISLILYFIYRRYLSKAMTVILSLSEEHYGKLVFIPLLSYITYSVFYLMMGYISVYPYMPKMIIYFVMIFGTIIIIYATMYIAMFYGIISAVKTTKIKAELEVAARIQTSNLPKALQEREDIAISARMETALEVGGDFYDYFFIDENHLAVVIADVSGKGVPAALFMMMSKTLIQNNSSYQYSPSDIFMHVNNQLYENNESQMFVTAFMGILEIDTGKFIYSNAGHNYPLISKKHGDYEYLAVNNGFVLAGRQDVKYQDTEILLEQGDKLLLYTDGVTEAADKNEKLFGETRLKQFLNGLDTSKMDLSRILSKIIQELQKFADGANQDDDITMLLMEYKKST
ncbi:MAG: PP2C family protein-serine/threonine phosphatase [Anaerocolumna sp.]